ncbi:MAG: SlyX family protein [Desulfobulbales bacterium]|nr:SlyX family protein [Desulfobulbales bacterium]
MATDIAAITARIVELETRLAFQDSTIEELNEVLVGQQRQLDRLESDHKRIEDRLKQLLDGPDQSHGY